MPTTDTETMKWSFPHFEHFVRMSGGYLALGIKSLFISIALFIYYRITRKQII